MHPHERRIVQFLSRPGSYPHTVTGSIIRRETHVSHVFLAGRFAYKLKKPVTFPFLDASSLAQRKKFCLLELSLNRRLAPAMYLGIVPIVERKDGLALGGTGAGRVVEWVVKMRRLPEDRMLDQMVAARSLESPSTRSARSGSLGIPPHERTRKNQGIARGAPRVSRRQMEEIADRLIRFFRRAARSRTIDRYGRPEQVAELVLGNLRECQPFIGTLLTESDRRVLEAAYRQYLALHEPLLRARVRRRRIIDGHGDLRCENICLAEPVHPHTKGFGVGVNIFDCVEFQPAFRCGDMANDFSFLVMDLEFRGRRDLASVLVNRYRAKLKDPTFDEVLAFYKCHRSLVRGKVRGFAWLQHPKTAQGRRVRTLARRHVQLARRYAREFAPPRLIVVGGLIGSGKSTLARGLAEALGARWLRSDEIRLTEFTNARRPRQALAAFAEGLYAPRVSELVYQRLIRRAEAFVRQGHSVVCDGTFSKASGRAALRVMAKRHGASFHFIECVVPRVVALRRIAKRYAAKADISEARPEHYDRLKAGFEPVRGWSSRDWTRLSDNRAPARTLKAALATLRRSYETGSNETASYRSTLVIGLHRAHKDYPGRQTRIALPTNENPSNSRRDWSRGRAG